MPPPGGKDPTDPAPAEPALPPPGPK
jgi:hypothetical protein